MTIALDDPAARWRADLVANLVRQGVLTEAWAPAFAAVPRHAFVDRFAVPSPDGLTPYDLNASDERARTAALQQVYRDTTLITQIDRWGIATSSSTTPSLMATMLEALDVHDGYRVLEIGTGTGYNAALLAHRLGDEHVVSIDVDPALVVAARTALERAGYRPRLVCGDGTAGVPEHAPYDRIIATCGVDRIPAPWITQLTPDGVILANISKGIARLQRAPDGGVSGPFLGPAGFMALRHTPGDRTQLPVQDVITLTGGTPERQHTEARIRDVDFATVSFFTGLLAPGGDLVRVHAPSDGSVSYRWVHSASGSWARIDLAADTAVVAEGGPLPLWEGLGLVLADWEQAGRPGITAYGLTVDRSGLHTMWRDTPSQPVITVA